jgi:hypothetical protein
MDRELAYCVARTAFRSAADLSGLVPLLHKHCSPEEASLYISAVTTAVGEIHSRVLNLVFHYYPDIEKEFSEKINKYNQLI